MSFEIINPVVVCFLSKKKNLFEHGFAVLFIIKIIKKFLG